MKIRPAKKEDLSECAKLFHSSVFKEASGDYISVHSLKYYLDKIYFLVAEENGEIAGALFGEALKGKGAILWDFAIKKNLRGKGIGSILLKSFEKNAKIDGKKWIFITAPHKSKFTHKFYNKHRYKKGTLNYEYLKKI
jgi:N-acetylglutamate synthase-like GNAT family acetyltransferase